MWQDRGVVSNVDRGVRLEGRCGGRTPIQEPAAKEPNDLIKFALGFLMFRKEVGGVDLAVHFQEPKLLPHKPLLHPQRVTLKVSELTNPLSTAYTQRGGQVRPDTDR